MDSPPNKVHLRGRTGSSVPKTCIDGFSDINLLDLPEESPPPYHSPTLHAHFHLWHLASPPTLSGNDVTPLPLFEARTSRRDAPPVQGGPLFFSFRACPAGLINNVEMCLCNTGSFPPLNNF